jgi:N-acetyl-beta-hexosaminidase
MEEESTERYRITVADGGLEIHSSDGKGLSFTAAEALMLLDILKNEEEKLKLLAEQASPLPIRIRF